ncbi:unnamed protein product [Allacma fusca]|uniref:Uncharacterized protein n=1 Tax=Allacma fusca TaxID=39272 RepID=A0A8J2LMH3_9HEXA|nr:unnamed protein product [Allacma fusca]
MSIGGHLEKNTSTPINLMLYNGQQTTFNRIITIVRRNTYINNPAQISLDINSSTYCNSTDPFHRNVIRTFS